MSGLRPLEGIVVADFSRVLAGPLSTMTLADLGARVIKVERPETGDDTRSWGPPFSATGATYFESVNRNKQSIALDLRNEQDREVARHLVSKADVLVENFITGGMDKMGLGYEELGEREWLGGGLIVLGVGVAELSGHLWARWRPARLPQPE